MGFTNRLLFWHHSSVPLRIVWLYRIRFWLVSQWWVPLHHPRILQHTRPVCSTISANYQQLLTTMSVINLLLVVTLFGGYCDVCVFIVNTYHSVLRKSTYSLQLCVFSTLMHYTVCYRKLLRYGRIFPVQTFASNAFSTLLASWCSALSVDFPAW